jgi:hypothetical protein
MSLANKKPIERKIERLTTKSTNFCFLTVFSFVFENGVVFRGKNDSIMQNLTVAEANFLTEASYRITLQEHNGNLT